MLVEVEAGLNKRLPLAILSQTVSEVDICLSGPDECGSGQALPRPSLLVPERSPPQASWTSGLVADKHDLMLSVGATGLALEAEPHQLSVGADVATNDGHPIQPTDDGPSTVHGTDSPPSVEDFIASLKLPLETPLIHLPPRLRVSCMRDENSVPRRSDRLAAMPAFRDPNPEK
jgi:hypothetical protein